LPENDKGELNGTTDIFIFTSFFFLFFSLSFSLSIQNEHIHTQTKVKEKKKNTNIQKKRKKKQNVLVNTHTYTRATRSSYHFFFSCIFIIDAMIWKARTNGSIDIHTHIQHSFVYNSQYRQTRRVITQGLTERKITTEKKKKRDELQDNSNDNNDLRRWSDKSLVSSQLCAFGKETKWLFSSIDLFSLSCQNNNIKIDLPFHQRTFTIKYGNSCQSTFSYLQIKSNHLFYLLISLFFSFLFFFLFSIWRIPLISLSSNKNLSFHICLPFPLIPKYIQSIAYRSLFSLFNAQFLQLTIHSHSIRCF